MNLIHRYKILDIRYYNIYTLILDTRYYINLNIDARY